MFFSTKLLNLLFHTFGDYFPYNALINFYTPFLFVILLVNKYLVSFCYKSCLFVRNTHFISIAILPSGSSESVHIYCLVWEFNSLLIASTHSFILMASWYEPGSFPVVNKQYVVYSSYSFKYCGVLTSLFSFVLSFTSTFD